MLGKHTEEVIEKIFKLKSDGYSDTKIHKITGLPRSTIYDILKSPFNISKFGGKWMEVRDPDAEIIEQNVKLAFQKQKLQDIQNVERKSFREFARQNNAIEALHEEMVNILREQKELLSSKIKVHTIDETEGSYALVVHLSDLHFGELIHANDVLNNKFDIDVAAKRLKKYVNRVKQIGKTFNVKSIAVLFGGDLIGSDRRLSEITAYAAARTNVVMNGYLILRDMLLDLNQDFKISIASVSGNESRLNDEFNSSTLLASDNFDAMIFHMLRHSLDCDSIKFLNEYDNPIEQVINIAGVNFLLVHGNEHKGVASSKNIETETEKLKAKYATMGVKIDYLVCGHYHSTLINSGYARSASLSGGNSYSDRTLNYNSAAAQNIYIINPDKTIDAMMVNLHKIDEITDGYYYDPSLISYFAQENKSNVIIQSVLV